MLLDYNTILIYICINRILLGTLVNRAVHFLYFKFSRQEIGALVSKSKQILQKEPFHFHFLFKSFNLLICLKRFRKMSEIENLEDQFKNHVEITKKCLEFAKGEPEATMTETNMAMIELGDLKRKMDILRDVVDKLKIQTDQAEKISEYMKNRIETCEFVCENLPKRMGNSNGGNKKGNPQNAKTIEKSVADCKEPKNKEKQKPSNISVPKVRYLTLQEFENIPKYMKGRWSYDGINNSIDEFNMAHEKKYTFLAKGFQAMSSVTNKKRFKVKYFLSLPEFCY